jgi:hypothetical protein
MYAGHFAAGLAIKARQPSAPTWAILLGTGFLDILFGIFVALGIEHVTMMPGVPPGFSLDFIDWSHSLVMSILWSIAFAAVFWRLGRAVFYALVLAVYSHFILDWFMHPGDLALWPHSALHVGFGLWRRLPVGWWFIELACMLPLLAYYVFESRREKSFGHYAVAACGVVLLLHVINSPWLSPSR